MTHTYATLEVTDRVFTEILDKLREAGYEHAFTKSVETDRVLLIDMHGLALVREGYNG